MAGRTRTELHIVSTGFPASADRTVHGGEKQSSTAQVVLEALLALFEQPEVLQQLFAASVQGRQAYPPECYLRNALWVLDTLCQFRLHHLPIRYGLDSRLVV